MLTVKQKTKAFLTHLYPILTRLNYFKNLDHTFYLPPVLTWTLRIGLPSFIFLTVTYIGIALGSIFSGPLKQNPADITPPPLPSISSSPIYSSPYNAIKEEMLQFSPSLPEPLYPVLDFEISVDPL